MIIAELWNVSNPLHSTASHVRWKFLNDDIHFISNRNKEEISSPSYKHCLWSTKEIPDHERQLVLHLGWAETNPGMLLCRRFYVRVLIEVQTANRSTKHWDLCKSKVSKEKTYLLPVQLWKYWELRQQLTQKHHKLVQAKLKKSNLTTEV